MRPGLFEVSRRWPRKSTRGNDGTSLREQRNFSLSSVQFVSLILPSNCHTELWTRLHAPAISSHNWPSEYALPPSLEWHVWSSSSGNNCHAVHRSLSSGASLCDGTVAFLPCLILSAKLYFTYWLPYSSHMSYHPSQTPCLPWISYATQKLVLDSYKMLQKLSEVFHTFLWHIFQV